MAEDERWPGLSTRLQANLQKNARASQVGMVAAAAPLDWEACVAPDYVPSETYPRLLGSDLAYDERRSWVKIFARSSHPLLRRPTRLPKPALWAREERPCRLDAERRQRRRSTK